MEKEEFKRLFDTYFDDIRRYVLYKCGSQEVATDIAQDTFLKIWEKNSRVDLSTVKSLMYKIANDLFVSNYRRKKVEFDFFSTFQPDQQVLTPDDELNYIDLKQTYHKALQSMPEKQRVVFLMSRIDQLKYAEIANTLNISVKTVENRMSMALRYLRKCVKK